MYNSAPRLLPGAEGQTCPGNNFTLSKARHKNDHPEKKIGFENLHLKKNTQLHWKFSVFLRNTTRFGQKKKKKRKPETEGLMGMESMLMI